MIYTFYSYKGGVGRTHLLANIAAYLCYYENKRILLIDWDLEAPGLHYYFGKKNEDIECKGLTELLNAHIDLFRNAAPDKTLSEKDFVSPFATNDYIQNMRTAEKGGKIDLMPAANYAEGYNTRIEDFDWIRFYDQFYGGSYLLWLRQELKKKYDFVLIDSRTGFNDYSGICNVLMPDMNVVLVAPNEQNFEGAKRMIRRIYDSSFTKSESRKPYVLPVLTRLDTSDERADEWRAKFAAEFAFTIGKLDKNLEAFGKEILELVSAMTYIAYNRRFSIGERLQFKEEAKPIIAGSDLTNFQNIAVQFLKKMNDTGSIDLNAMIGDKMMPVYLRNIRENPQDYDSLFGLAYAYYEQDNYTEAQRYYEKTVVVKPDFHAAWYNLGRVYDDLQNYAKAVECYQKAIEIKPDFYEACNNLGNVYYDLQNYAKAVECYQKAIELKPDKYEAWHNLGNVYYDLQNYAKAVECCQKAIEIKPDYDEAWNNLGRVYDAQQNYAKAVECYQKAIEIKPDYDKAWYNLGNMYYAQQNYAKAVECYQRAIEIKPDFHEAWNNLGLAYRKLENYEKAVECYQKAIEIKPDKHEAWYSMGNAYYNLQNYEKAVECFQKAIEIKPDKHEAWYNLGSVYDDLQNYAKAVECYQKAIELKPDYDKAWNNLGLTYHNLQNYEKAVVCYQKAIEIKPDKHEAWYNWGNTYYAQQNYAKAVECFQKAIEIKPDYANAFYNLACVYALQQQKEKALSYLQAAISLNPEDKKQAQTDTDFEWLWGDADFRKMTE